MNEGMNEKEIETGPFVSVRRQDWSLRPEHTDPFKSPEIMILSHYCKHLR